MRMMFDRSSEMLQQKFLSGFLLRGLLPLFFSFALLSCSSIGQSGEIIGDGEGGTRISNLRPPLPGTKKVTLELSEKEYEDVLVNGGELNVIRLVEIFSRNRSPESPPEYRMLGVRPNSVYTLLGLESADVLVAANDYVVPNAAVFWQFLHLMHKVEGSSIEVRREGVPMIFLYKFS